ncbi:MAG: TolC family protein [Acidobacteriia bacterium]|nr:TolC family protein [Terriglobia bacterium]
MLKRETCTQSVHPNGRLTVPRLHNAAGLVLLALNAACLHAQGGPPGPPPARAEQLPLSGRTGSPGGVDTVQNPVPGGAQTVNTLSSNVQVQGAYQGSVPAAQAAGAILPLTLADAIRRGLEYNLGTVGYQNAARQARAQELLARSALLPNVSGYALLTEEQVNLATFGFHFNLPIPGFTFPTIVGPFHYIDLRAQLTQTVVDLTTLRNYRASRQNAKATDLSAQDARDLVVLAVTGGYLSIISAAARIDSARAQVASAQALYQQAFDRHNAGVAARIDVTRSQVELQTQQQRLTSEETDFAKQKIQLGRLIGLPPGQDFTLSDTLPYAPITGLTLDQALQRAAMNRADLKAAQAQMEAAELTKKAAAAERYPTVQLAGDYGVNGTSPQNSHGTFSVTGSVRFPIWEGGRIRGDIEQADAALSQRRSEYEDLRGRVDADIRQAFLDLTAAANQVTVAQSNRELAQETLTQARDRFAAGVADTVEVVQAQEQVAGAEQDYISSLYAHNLAKASLARSMGQAEQGIQQLLGRP